MKKQYEAPKAEKVEFDYKEMVTASDIPTPNNATRCINPCQSQPTLNGWVKGKCGRYYKFC